MESSCEAKDINVNMCWRVFQANKSKLIKKSLAFDFIIYNIIMGIFP